MRLLSGGKIIIFSLLCLLATGVKTAMPIAVTDAVGRAIQLPAEPHRIISLAPNITEMLFAIGAGQQVVGVTDFCDFPPEARTKTRVGGFVNPSMEAIVSANPDLVLGTADGNRPADILKMEKIGLTVYVINTLTIGDIYESIKLIGYFTGHDQEAARLLEELAQNQRRLSEAVRGREKRRVIFLVGKEPLVAAGPGTFIDHLINEAGGINALEGRPVKYPLLGLEGMLSLDPDLVILTAMGEDRNADFMTGNPAWQKLRAYREGRIYFLDDDTLLRPGPRIVEGLRALVSIIHPELVGTW